MNINTIKTLVFDKLGRVWIQIFIVMMLTETNIPWIWLINDIDMKLQIKIVASHWVYHKYTLGDIC